MKYRENSRTLNMARSNKNNGTSSRSFLDSGDSIHRSFEEPAQTNSVGFIPVGKKALSTVSQTNKSEEPVEGNVPLR